MKLVVGERIAAQLRELGWTDSDMIIGPPVPDAATLAAMARYRSTLPGRMAEADDRLNGALSHVLPEGIHFEWETTAR